MENETAPVFTKHVQEKSSNVRNDVLEQLDHRNL